MAVVGYVSSMIELGRTQAATEFFESVNPGITSADYVPPGLNEVFIQFTLVHALLDMGSFETANAIGTKLTTLADQVFPAWRDDNYVMANVSIAQGDRDAAIEYTLKDLDQPLGKNLNWRFEYQHIAWMKPLLSDQQVANRMAELEAATQVAGDEVRVMLAESATL